MAPVVTRPGGRYAKLASDKEYPQINRWTSTVVLYDPVKATDYLRDPQQIPISGRR